MKTLLALAITFLVLAANGQSQIITKIASMGQFDFSVDSSVTTALYSQSPVSLDFNGSQALGSTLGGLWNPITPKDWSSYQLTDFGLLGKVNGTNPPIPFTLELYDSNLQIANTFTGSTFGATSSQSFMTLTLSLPGNGNMNDITGLQFTWDAADSINFEWEGMAVVPEPTTISLLVLGSTAFIFRFLRRRLRK